LHKKIKKFSQYSAQNTISKRQNQGHIPMSWKVIGQTAESSAPLPKHQALQELDDVNTPIDWASIEAKLSDLHASKRGEKAWPLRQQLIDVFIF
jgi:hypothetical protein